jgi:hypothetical protein
MVDSQNKANSLTDQTTGIVTILSWKTMHENSKQQAMHVKPLRERTSFLQTGPNVPNERS